MDFYDVLDQVLDLLRNRGRVTYRALKLQFKLDSDHLEALKDELLYAHPQVVDDDGHGLVWTGEASPSPAPAPQPAQGTRQQVQHADQFSPQAASAPAAGHPLEAERRQLTIVFCDLVDSTALSSRLDPEDYREVVRAYQQTCAEVIQSFEGYIAQYLGDGLLIYSGYPQAHEDDGQRAVRTGLGILEAIKTLNSRLERDKGVRLAVRVGIHTGLVVVGEIGGDGRQEQLALGETPNIAARIQGIAEPDSVGMSAATYRLVQGFFTCHDLGLHILKGLAAPIQVLRALRESGVQTRVEVAAAGGLTLLVGREQEVGLLVERWERTTGGMGQVVLLTGEAGIGKSRLVQVLKEHVAKAPHTQLEGRCAPYYQNTALYPVIDLCERAWKFERDDSPPHKLEKMALALSQYRLALEETMPLFASLLSLPLADDRYPPRRLTPERQRHKMLETILAILLEMASRQPVLFIVEDLHWVDPSTLELLTLLIDQGPTAAIFTLLTYRPAFQPSWALRTHVTPIALNRLTKTQIEVIVQHVAGGKSLPPEVIRPLVTKTDGVPLFVEEMTKAVLESGWLRDVGGRYELIGPLPPLAIPATLQDSLMARLDRLGTAKGVAQLAATLGRSFAYELLHTVSQLDEGTLQRELGRLVEAELLYPQGVPPQATYIFKHALIQDAAYQSLLKSTRQQYHQRIAQVLVGRFPETAGTQPELLAHHYTEAGHIEQAIGYWQRAGEKATQRSAHVEAIAHLTKGLEILRALSDTPARAQDELRLLTRLRLSLAVTKGYAAPELQQVNSRMRALCQQVEEPTVLLGALGGLWTFYLARAEVHTARELAEQVLTLAQGVQRNRQAILPLPVPPHRPFLWGHVMLGQTLFVLGEFPGAREHAELGMTLYDPQVHRPQVTLVQQDPGIMCLATTAQALWHLGYPEQALQRSHEALAMAQELAHPYSLVWALGWTALLLWHRREYQAALERSEAAVALAAEQGFTQWVAQGTILRGWALATQGQGEEGIDQIQQGLAAYRATGTELLRPFFLALLTEAYRRVGRSEAGLAVLAEALRMVDDTGERWYQAELYRLKGELLLDLAAEHRAEAVTCLQQARAIARRQQAKLLELRAATSLSRLWRQQGKQDEAHQLLAEIHGWFTEGFDTADLLEAKALLEAARP